MEIMIRIMTSGESHGKAMTVVIDGFPAGVTIDRKKIDRELSRRQHGYGRGERMKIESDMVTIVSGVRAGVTIGSPITLMIENKDHVNWQDRMSPDPGTEQLKVTAPRPGHADLAGVQKYAFDDIRNVLERASARETVCRVAAGSVCKQLLYSFDVQILSRTIAVGNVHARSAVRGNRECETSPLRCADAGAEQAMMQAIDQARAQGDSLGGVCEIVGRGVPPGLGSYVQSDQRLDGLVAQAMMSIPSVKGVEIGPAFENTSKPGSQVHDEIVYCKNRGFYRATNRAGGIEGGMSTGGDIVVRCGVKPIPTLPRPLSTVDIGTKEPRPAQKERADTCVVPAIGVIAEHMLAIVLCQALVSKFGGDCLVDIQAHVTAYRERIRNV
jgi:chorismate synthase